MPRIAADAASGVSSPPPPPPPPQNLNDKRERPFLSRFPGAKLKVGKIHRKALKKFFFLKKKFRAGASVVF